MATSNIILSLHDLVKHGEPFNSDISYQSKIDTWKLDGLIETWKLNDLSGLLERYYLPLLENTNPVLFPYLNARKKKELLRELHITKLLLLTQSRYEEAHQKYENVTLDIDQENGDIGVYDTKINQCNELIEILHSTNPAPEGNEAQGQRQRRLSADSPVQYLGLSLGQLFAQEMMDINRRKTKSLKTVMRRFNEKRLYWVWGSSFIKTMLELLPADFFNTEQGKQTVRIPDPYTGCISWALYYFRFALNLGLLLKHTIDGPWMHEAESQIGWEKRFQTQWQQRKFTLLNDSIWATGNLLCFFWLNGKGAMGSAGDLLTIALLLFDVTAGIWGFEEARVDFNAEMLAYNQQIDELENRIITLRASSQNMNLAAIREEEARLFTLQKNRKICQREWNIQKVSLINDLTYAIALLLAFTLLTMPFLPVSTAVMPVLSVVGAVLCFAFTVINNAVKVGVDVYRAHVTAKEVKDEYLLKVDAFKELLVEDDERVDSLKEGLDDNKKKLLFLEIQQLMAENDYQKRMKTFQTIHLVRATLIESLMPAIILANLVFFPVGMGLSVIGAVIGLAIGTNLLLNQFKPEKGAIEYFNEAYVLFAKNPDAWILAQESHPTYYTSRMFPPAPRAEENDYLDEHLNPRLE